VIDEDLARAAQEALSALLAERSVNVRTEIQNGGQFLLLSVAPQAPGQKFEVSALLRATIRQCLGKALPHDASQPLGNWMVVFLEGSSVVDSVYPGGL